MISVQKRNGSGLTQVEDYKEHERKKKFQVVLRESRYDETYSENLSVLLDLILDTGNVMQWRTSMNSVRLCTIWVKCG